jgi:hypothetical protein
MTSASSQTAWPRRASLSRSHSLTRPPRRLVNCVENVRARSTPFGQHTLLLTGSTLTERNTLSLSKISARTGPRGRSSRSTSRSAPSSNVTSIMRACKCRTDCTCGANVTDPTSITATASTFSEPRFRRTRPKPLRARTCATSACRPVPRPGAANEPSAPAVGDQAVRNRYSEPGTGLDTGLPVRMPIPLAGTRATSAGARAEGSSGGPGHP